MRFMLGILKKGAKNGAAELAWINGEPGLVLSNEAGLHSVLTLSVGDDVIRDVWIVVNPDKLARVREPSA